MNPTALRINNKTYEINTDFRTWIKFERLLGDCNITEEAKHSHVLGLIFLDKPSLMNIEIFRSLLNFYLCGKYGEHSRHSGHSEPKNSGKPTDNTTLYDFKIDNQKIKGSFIAKFGFNPWGYEYYHWWDFKACFDNLLGASFENIIKARTIDLSEFKGKQKNEMQKIRDNAKLWTSAELKAEKERVESDKKLKEAYKNGNIAEYLRGVNEHGISNN